MARNPIAAYAFFPIKFAKVSLNHIHQLQHSALRLKTKKSGKNLAKEQSLTNKIREALFFCETKTLDGAKQQSIVINLYMKK
jgi:hypothetical protein